MTLMPLAIHVTAVPVLWVLAAANGDTWAHVAMTAVLMIPGLVASWLAYQAAMKAADRAQSATIVAGKAVEVSKAGVAAIAEVQTALAENTDTTVAVKNELAVASKRIDGMKDQLVEAVRGRALSEGQQQGVAAEQKRTAGETADPAPVHPTAHHDGPQGTVVTAATEAAKAAVAATAAEMTRIAKATESTAVSTGGLLDRAKEDNP